MVCNDNNFNNTRSIIIYRNRSKIFQENISIAIHNTLIRKSFKSNNNKQINATLTVTTPTFDRTPPDGATIGSLFL